MKNRNFVKNSIGLLLPLAMSMGVLFGTHQTPAKEAVAYDASGLPTTIYLGAVAESDIRSYYSNANGKSGNELLKALKPILMNNQKYYSYDSGDNIWKMYEISDRDWDKSPASEIKSGKYNASTQTITNYKYRNTSVEDPYVRALYVNRNADNPKTAWASHGERSDVRTIEREHIWPKSHGFDGGSMAGARGDPMHLWAADGTVNGMHSNNFYAYVNTSLSSTKDAGDKFSILSGNFTGKSKTLGGTQEVFEPQDSDKGDIARACFYMVARYNNLAKNDSSIGPDNPNLTLTNTLTDNSATGQSTSSQAYSLGLVQDLLEWNKLDPVDDYEIKRNDIIFRNYTNNRNPFIDFPQWADIIWGGKSGSANPSTDVLNDSGSSTKILRSIAVTTQPTKTTYSAGESFSSNGMVVTAYYSDNTSSEVSGYTISNTNPLKCADKLITVSYQGCTTTVRITVNAVPTIYHTYDLVKSSSDLVLNDTYVIAAQGYDVAMSTTQNDNNRGEAPITKSGDNLSIVEPTSEDDPEVQLFTLEAGSVTGSYSFNTGSGYIYAASSGSNCLKTESTKTANSSWEISFNNGTTNAVAQGSNTRNVLQYNSSHKLFSCYSTTQKDISLYRRVSHTGSFIHPDSVTISDNSIELEVGEHKELSATVGPNNVSDNSVNWVSSNEDVATVDEFGKVTAVGGGTAVITACANDTTGNISASCTLNVPYPVILSSLTLSGNYKQNYYTYDEFSSENLVVTAHYTQGNVEVSTEDVTSSCDFDGFDSLTAGTKTISVSFEGVSASFQVNITKEANTAKFVTSKYAFSNGETVGTIEEDDFSVVFNSAGTKYYDGGAAIRVYSGNTFTISGAYKITSVDFVFGPDDGTNAFSTDTGTCNSATGSWSYPSGANSVTYTVSNLSGNNRRIQKIIVRYDPTKPTGATLEGITLSGDYPKTFTVGDEFDTTNLVVTAHYSDSSTAVVTNECSFSGYNMNSATKQTVTVTYKSVTETYEITVNEAPVINSQYVFSNESSSDSATAFTTTTLASRFGTALTSGANIISSVSSTSYVYEGKESSIKISSSNNNGSIIFSTTVDIIGVVINAKRYSASTATPVKLSVNGGECELNANYNEFIIELDSKTKEIALTSNGRLYISGFTLIPDGGTIPEPSAPVLTGITVSGSMPTEFALNETFDSTGLIVTASYTLGDDVVVTPTSISSPDMTTAGRKTVTVSYTEGSVTVEDSYEININAVSPKKYVKASGEVLDGDYIFYYNTYVIKNEIVSSRTSYKTLSGITNEIDTFDQSIVWHIEKVGDYYTVYNTAIDKYLAGNGTRNQAALVNSVTDNDYAKWTITHENGEYEFVNFGNNNKGVNDHLRNNGTNGWACYSTSTGGAFNLFRLENTEFVKTTNIADIQDGDILTFGSVNSSKEYFMSATDGYLSNYDLIAGKSDIVSADGRYLISSEDLLTFKVVQVGSYYSLLTKYGYLTYVSGSPHIGFSNTNENDLSQFEFEFVNGSIYIHVKNDTERYLRFNYNSGNPRFGFYTKGYGESVNIYETRSSGEAEAWSIEFLKATTNCVLNSWDSLKASYDNLTNEAKEILKSAVADKSESANSVAQAMARYERTLEKHPEATNFIEGRTTAPSNNLSLISINNIDTSTVLIIVFSVVGVTAIGSYFVFKRRKELN